MGALDLLFVFQLAVLAVAVLGITWAIESAPAIVRFRALRKLRREARDRKRTADWNRLHPAFGDEAESK
ncbi:MAG: hypothetical protein DRJ65_00215 [Acidobacteria bacterium]|nr:MAG: hypothetical protein DRJ65_00215 [Acidobacteriota bacterium]